MTGFLYQSFRLGLFASGAMTVVMFVLLPGAMTRSGLRSFVIALAIGVLLYLTHAGKCLKDEFGMKGSDDFFVLDGFSVLPAIGILFLGLANQYRLIGDGIKIVKNRTSLFESRALRALVICLWVFVIFYPNIFFHEFWATDHGMLILEPAGIFIRIWGIIAGVFSGIWLLDIRTRKDPIRWSHR